MAIIYKLKRGKRMKIFGNIDSISQTHRFHKFFIHISLSTHTAGDIAKPVTFYWFVTIVWRAKLHFWKCFNSKKAKKMDKIWENRASLSKHNISQNLHRFFTLNGISCYLFLVWSYSFKLYAIHQQLWKYLKVQKFMSQHNFETIHFKCTIPAIQCIIPVLLF